MKKIKILLAGIISLTISVNAFAYDPVGHRIIADIAYQSLSHKVQKKLDNLLGVHGLIYKATWADEVRSDPHYSYSYQWHYQDMDDNMSDEQLNNLLQNPAQEGKHLFFALDSLTKVLKQDKSNTEALKFIIHFVGDLHQPLHLGRKDDKGGNTVEYTWFGRKTNLHAVWDGFLIENNRMSYSEYSNYLQDKFVKQKSDLEKQSLLQSVKEVYKVRNAIYTYDYTEKSNYKYAYRFSASLDSLLFRGGIQLAKILNDIYK